MRVWAHRDSKERVRRAKKGDDVSILVLLLVTIFAPAIAPYDPYEIRVGPSRQAPSNEHLFATDDLGRDLLSRIFYGSRITLQIGTISIALALGVGVLFELVVGYYGGWVDSLLMRFTDVMLAVCSPPGYEVGSTGLGSRGSVVTVTRPALTAIRPHR